MLAVTLLAAAVLLAPSQWVSSAAQPETYSSPSGEWTVLVDPQEWEGTGAATYAVERGGMSIWTAEFPFTFQDAVIDDAGYLAGFATVVPADEPRALGQFVVALVSPSGELVAQHATDREANHYSSHSIPDPKARGIVLDQEHQRFVVRVDHPRLSWSWLKWAPFDLRTGDRLEEFVPHELAGYSQQEDDGPNVLTAGSVAGSPAYVTVGMQFRFDLEPRVDDLVIEVFDTAGHPIGTRTHEREIEDERDLWDEVAPNVLLLGATPGDFSVWLPRSNERVDYRVFQRPNDEGWDLKELRRTEYRPPAPTFAVHPKAEDVELRLIAEVELQAPQPASALFDKVSRFGIDELGRVMVVERNEVLENVARCLLVTPDGELLYESTFEFPAVEDEVSYTWTPFESGEWLVFVEKYGEGEPNNAEAWWVVPETGQRIELPHWRESISEGFSLLFPDIASTRDGGFLLSGSHQGEYTMITKMGSFDHEGRTRWIRDKFGAPRNSVSMIGMGKVTITADGGIATLGMFDTISRFTSEGTWLDSLDLEELWGEEHLSISALHAELAGGFVAIVNGRKVLARRIDADGTIREDLELRRADGSSDSWMAHRTRIAPDGRIWSSDGFTIMRHGPDGIADRTLGGLPEQDALNVACTIKIDPWGGRVIVQDKRTAALHVFGSNGARRFVAHPASDDHDSLPLMMGSRIVARSDGRLYSSLLRYPGEGWCVYGAGGERLGIEELGGRHIAFCPGDRRWRLARETTRLLAGDGTVLARISRRADGSWFEFPDDIAVSSDGAVAIIDRARPTAISLYHADGAPRSDHALPDGAGSVYYIAYQGRWVAAWGWNEAVWLLNVEGGSWLRFPAPWPVNGNARIEVGFSADGSELWMVDSGATVLRRYALPQE